MGSWLLAEQDGGGYDELLAESLTTLWCSIQLPVEHPTSGVSLTALSWRLCQDGDVIADDLLADIQLSYRNSSAVRCSCDLWSFTRRRFARFIILQNLRRPSVHGRRDVCSQRDAFCIHSQLDCAHFVAATSPRSRLHNCGLRRMLWVVTTVTMLLRVSSHGTNTVNIQSSSGFELIHFNCINVLRRINAGRYFIFSYIIIFVEG